MMEKNTRNGIFPLQAEKEVSHLDMYSSQAGKGTRHWEKRSRGLGGTASPRGCETDGRFGSGVVTERPASVFCCKSTQHNTAQGLAAQPGRLAGGTASFQTGCIQKAPPEMLHGQFSLGKRLLTIREGRGIVPDFTSLPSLHTGPHRQLREGLAAPMLICPLCQQYRVLRQPPPALHINTAHMDQKRLAK